MRVQTGHVIVTVDENVPRDMTNFDRHLLLEVENQWNQLWVDGKPIEMIIAMSPLDAIKLRDTLDFIIKTRSWDTNPSIQGLDTDKGGVI